MCLEESAHCNGWVQFEFNDKGEIIVLEKRFWAKMVYVCRSIILLIVFYDIIVIKVIYFIITRQVLRIVG